VQCGTKVSKGQTAPELGPPGADLLVLSTAQPEWPKQNYECLEPQTATRTAFNQVMVQLPPE